MPSLRKRVSSYFRQLSFHNEPREKRHNLIENTFINKYLQGEIKLKDGPPIIHGKNPTDLPSYDLGAYSTGPESIVGCYTGPHGGLTTVKRTEKHLSVLDQDIDFIDTVDEPVVEIRKAPVAQKSPNRYSDIPLDNTTMLIKVAGQEYLVTNRKKRHNKSHSLGSLSDFKIEVDKTKKISSDNIDFNDARAECDKQCDNSNDDNDNLDAENKVDGGSEDEGNVKSNFALGKSKSEGNPFGHKKRGKITRLTERPTANPTENKPTDGRTANDDPNLPPEWNKKTEHVFGISDSLYDKNLISKNKNGDPIADCFGVIARSDSAILAVADGVNWGEKACIAAKSAIHGCLHYLNKTIFQDTELFDNLVKNLDDVQKSDTPRHEPCINNTREVFVCLLRAFNCAHDLILENEGMLTTLTVAVILPLKQSNVKSPRNLNQERRSTEMKEGSVDSYICCVCNVGDTLAYVYSQRYGVRELTKGSHDINCNRDMRDALGALGPVDGINPELSNLTLSVSIIQKGDIVLIASDGLTDNFDPNVCKFTVNSEMIKTRKPSTTQTPQPANKNAKNTHKQTTKSKEKSIQKPTTKVKERSVERETNQTRGKSAEKEMKQAKPEVKQQKVPVKPPRKSQSLKVDQSGSKRDPSFKNAEHTKNAVDNLKSSSIENTNRNVNSGDVNENKNVQSVSINNKNEENPLIAQFLRENSVEENTSTEKIRNQGVPKPIMRKPMKSASERCVPQTLNPKKQNISDRGYNFLRSKTSLDLRANKTIPRNPDGIPYVTPLQRYELTLLFIEDILKRGISGKESQIVTARKLCENLYNFTVSITNAKRRSLEDVDLYYNNQNGILVEVSQQERKARRKRGLEKALNLPGKLDHVTVVAYNVGNTIHSPCSV